MKLDEAVRSVLNKYAVFEGRSSRSEYWYWMLFLWLCLVLAVIALIVVAAVLPSPVVLGAFQILLVLFYLAAILPSIAVTVRRFHDLGKSAWNLLWSLIPFGGLYLLYLYVQPSQPGANAYGDQPSGTAATAA